MPFSGQGKQAKKEQHLPQLLEDDADIVPYATEQGVDFVTQLTQQEFRPNLPSVFM